jgi:hypothetical protein
MADLVQAPSEDLEKGVSELIGSDAPMLRAIIDVVPELAWCNRPTLWD